MTRDDSLIEYHGALPARGGQVGQGGEGRTGGLHIVTCAGTGAAPYLDDLVRLRIAVFRDWPYLYEGDPSRERDCLDAYARSPRSVFVIVLHGDEVIGASTGIPLAEHDETFQQPLLEHGMDIDEVYYFSESFLRREYLGRGIGHCFFDEREAYALRLGGFRWTAFCALERSTDDHRQPEGHRPNNIFWHGRGYQRQDELCCCLDWPEAGDRTPSPHRMQFWMRPLVPGESRL